MSLPGKPTPTSSRWIRTSSSPMRNHPHLPGDGLSSDHRRHRFETIQARFNYRLYLMGRTEEELLANLTQGTRRKVRIAMRNGVEVRPVGPEYLDEFVRIMRVTGERDASTCARRRISNGCSRRSASMCGSIWIL